MATRPAFTVAGIPVTIHPAFFAVILVLGLVYLATPVYLFTWVAIATVSILLHEFGHAIAFRIFGLRPSVSLVGFGGLTSAEGPDGSTDDFTPVRHIIVSLAGPLSALILLGLPALLIAEANGFDPWTSLGMRRSLDPAEIILGQIVYINVGWSLLNLLPVLPLDGGRAMAALSPSLWFVGYALLVAATIAFPNPVMLLVLLLGGFETWRRWQARNTPEAREFHRVPRRTRIVIAALYLGLVAALAVGVDLTFIERDFGDV